MNKLFFILPDDRRLSDSALGRCRLLCGFLDHETYESYWDERQYKRLRGPINGSDRLSRGLRRLKVLDFTDYRDLPGLSDEYKLQYNGIDYTSEIYGRFIAARKAGENVALVETSSGLIPKSISVWYCNQQMPPESCSPILNSIKTASDWFSVNRCPKRVFNYEAKKHQQKEYMIDGVVVSALKMTKTEIENALRLAIGAKSSRRLLHCDIAAGRIVVFSDENRSTPEGSIIYHGHQLNISDVRQIRRLPFDILKKLELLYDIRLV